MPRNGIDPRDALIEIKFEGAHLKGFDLNWDLVKVLNDLLMMVYKTSPEPDEELLFKLSPPAVPVLKKPFGHKAKIRLVILSFSFMAGVIFPCHRNCEVNFGEEKFALISDHGCFCCYPKKKEKFIPLLINNDFRSREMLGKILSQLKLWSLIKYNDAQHVLRKKASGKDEQLFN